MLITKTEKDIFILALLIVLYVLECLFPYFDTFKNKTLHTVRNVGLIALNAVVINVLLMPVVVFSVNTSWGVFNSVLPDWKLELILTVALIDGLTYVMHVLFHRISFLWRFHRMHHSDTEMDVTSGARFHIGEHAISTLVRCGLYAVFAMKLEYILFYEAVFLANVFFHHSNLSMGEGLDRWYRVLLTSPNMHKVHHSNRRVETDSNYTSLFSVWDRMFGTYRVVENPREIVYGIKGLEEEQTIRKMLMTPFKRIDAE